MLGQIKQEIGKDSFYQQNFANDGQRFLAWYLRRILLLDPVTARDATDGADDKQVDAVIIDDDEGRILIPRRGAPRFVVGLVAACTGVSAVSAARAAWSAASAWSITVSGNP